MEDMNDTIDIFIQQFLLYGEVHVCIIHLDQTFYDMMIAILLITTLSILVNASTHIQISCALVSSEHS